MAQLVRAAVLCTTAAGSSPTHGINEHQPTSAGISETTRSFTWEGVFFCWKEGEAKPEPRPTSSLGPGPPCAGRHLRLVARIRTGEWAPGTSRRARAAYADERARGGCWSYCVRAPWVPDPKSPRPFFAVGEVGARGARAGRCGGGGARTVSVCVK